MNIWEEPKNNLVSSMTYFDLNKFGLDLQKIIKAGFPFYLDQFDLLCILHIILDAYLIRGAFFKIIGLVE